ncbi:MAG TPA: dihydrofolate reductase family protein, partial [Acidobacteriaceae bacterium]|nr:dihydrofolate reductase family protein [Acidobacteriaceae bacterium]
EALGVQVERLAPDPETGRLPLAAVMERLAAMDITNVMLESGASLNAAALSAGIVDKLFLFYAPAIYGDTAVPLVRAQESTGFSGVRVNSYKLYPMGEDFGVEAYIQNPWQD